MVELGGVEWSTKGIGQARETDEKRGVGAGASTQLAVADWPYKFGLTANSLAGSRDLTKGRAVREEPPSEQLYF